MLFVYSTEDPVSLGAAERLKRMLGMEHDKEIEGNMHFSDGVGTQMLELRSHLVHAEDLDCMIKANFVVFLSRHRSANGVTSFTVHSEGNWSAKAELGGKPKELGVAAPVQMLRFLRAIKDAGAKAASEVPVVYEATHHGPLLKTPSFFAELGGNEEAMNSGLLQAVLAEAAASFARPPDDAPYYSKVVMHIGGMHYSAKATKLALERGYAFAHIMPKYYVDEIDMIGQAFSRSDRAPEIALIEWKSINADKRNKIINRLEELGIDYERA